MPEVLLVIYEIYSGSVHGPKGSKTNVNYAQGNSSSTNCQLDVISNRKVLDGHNIIS